jgi:hypothetical protein
MVKFYTFFYDKPTAHDNLFLLLDHNSDVPALRGKDVLQDLVRNNRDEYNKLTKQEHINLVEEFEKEKATKTKGFRVSTKSRINDAMHTLVAVESEVHLYFINIV